MPVNNHPAWNELVPGRFLRLAGGMAFLLRSFEIVSINTHLWSWGQSKSIGRCLAVAFGSNELFEDLFDSYTRDSGLAINASPLVKPMIGD